jgi:hypothetical protein
LVRCREIPNLIALILSLEPPLLIDGDGATAERVVLQSTDLKIRIKGGEGKN